MKDKLIIPDKNNVQKTYSVLRYAGLSEQEAANLTAMSVNMPQGFTIQEIKRLLFVVELLMNGKVH